MGNEDIGNSGNSPDGKTPSDAAKSEQDSGEVNELRQEVESLKEMIRKLAGEKAASTAQTGDSKPKTRPTKNVASPTAKPTSASAPPKKPEKKKSENKKPFVPKKIGSPVAAPQVVNEEQPEIPLEPPLVNPYIAFRIRQGFGVIAIVIVVGGLVYWLQGGFSSSSGDSNSNRVSSMEIGADLFSTDSNSTDFERFLLRGDLDELLDAKAQLEPAEDEAFAIGLEKRQRQIAICDRILSLSPDDEVAFATIRSKLQLMMDRELLSLQNGVTTEDMNVELNAALVNNQGSSDASVKRLVELGNLLLYVREFLMARDAERRTRLQRNAVSNFSSVAMKHQEEFDAASLLSRFVKIIEFLGRSGEKVPFEDAYLDAFDQSSNEEIVQLVRSFSEGRLEQRFPDFDSVLASERQKLINETMDQFRKALDPDNMAGNETVKIALQRAGELLSIGKYAESKEIIELLGQQNISDRPSIIGNEFDKLQVSMALFENPLDVSCAQDVEYRPAKFVVKNAKYRVLYFASYNDYEKSSSRFKDLTIRFGNLLKDQTDLELVLMFVDVGNQPQPLESIRTFGRRSVYWQVWLVDKQSDAGRELMDKFPFPKTPFSVVLDQGNRVVALDPDIDQIDRLITAD